MTKMFIAAEIAPYFDTADILTDVDGLRGEVYRQVENRRTLRVTLGEHDYFAKIHHGVGWGEIFKNLFQFRLPVLGARNEWQAIQHLTAADVRTMTAVLFCERGINPATRRSAILTQSLGDRVSLEDYLPENLQVKRRIINEVADMSRKMHAAGVNHRDFYLCHFLMGQADRERPELFLIDLHRAQIRSSVPERWLVKDLGGLLFSAFDKPLTRRDLLRFVRVYRPGGLRHALTADRRFWLKVIARARRLYLQDHKTVPTQIERLLTAA